MSPTKESRTVQTWITAFIEAIDVESAEALARLFDSNAYWRNVMALGWTTNTVERASAISSAMLIAIEQAGLNNVRLDPSSTPPRIVTRAGVQAIEAFLLFDTQVGRGRGIVRIKSTDSLEENSETACSAWTLLTALYELKGLEEAVGSNRPTGQVHSRDFRGPNWLDRRHLCAAFADREPAVLVVGAGQAGLSIAARLTQLGIDTLVLEKNQRVGDNWRNRYHALTLHNQVHANHLPYMPFPESWPVYIPKDKLANWLEAYSDAMELNVWTESELLESSYNAKEKCWSAKVAMADGNTRILAPRHIVLATSVSGIPNLPDIPGISDYKGQLIHASSYVDGENHSDKSALVIGAGTSGHDIAQDLASSGADVTMVQRGPTMIINIEPGAQLPYALYHEGPNLEECDLITTAMPYPLQRKSHIEFTRIAKDQDWSLLSKLEQRGMQLDYGVDGTGWQFKYLTRGGGYYFNVGASEMIAEGKISLVQFKDIKQFNKDGLKLSQGQQLKNPYAERRGLVPPQRGSVCLAARGR